MADIIIKGMEMPKDGRIIIQIGSDGAVYFVEKCTIMAEKYEKSSHAIQLPPHGRLGDLDALQDEFKKFHDGKRSMLIDTAPTIVPAEGGGEDGNA